MRNKQIEMFRA